MMTTAISVDTGNRIIKTAHAEPFSAGLVRHFNSKPVIATDILCWNGNYYTFSENIDYHRRDKTVDDYYYVLTLAAIARELVMKKHMDMKKNVTSGDSFAAAMKAADRKELEFNEEIFLTVGLPPRDLKGLGEKFKKYFLGDKKHVSFSYNNIKFKILIKDVCVIPQGFAAILPNEIYNKVIQFPQAYIIDIGGYTTDVALVANRQIDTGFFESLEFGAIHLNHRVFDRVNEVFQCNISQVLVESVLRGASTGKTELDNLVKEVAMEYAAEIIAALKDRRIDLTISLPVFVGGGALLIKDYLLKAVNRPESIVIEDIRANAIGYEVFAKRILQERMKKGID